MVEGTDPQTWRLHSQREKTPQVKIAEPDAAQPKELLWPEFD
jgi:hypothetical protein